MAKLKTTQRVEAPRDRVFDIFSDVPRAGEMIEDIVRIEMLTDGPVGVGTRWRETRTMFKRQATEEMEVTAFDRGRRYTVRCESCGCVTEWTWRFEPRGEATLVELEMNSRPVTFLAKVMSPIGSLMTPLMKKCIERDVGQLKTLAESGPVRAATEGGAPA